MYHDPSSAAMMTCDLVLSKKSQRNPLNERDPVDGYEEHLEPIIRGAREARLKAAGGQGGRREGDGFGDVGLGHRSKL